MRIFLLAVLLSIAGFSVAAQQKQIVLSLDFKPGEFGQLNSAIDKPRVFRKKLAEFVAAFKVPPMNNKKMICEFTPTGMECAAVLIIPGMCPRQIEVVSPDGQRVTAPVDCTGPDFDASVGAYVCDCDFVK